jgi:hypothetical protein
MSSMNGRADWPDDEAYVADLANYISKRTGLSVQEVDLAERTSRLYEAACYRSFGGPIMLGFESTDFAALNAKHPDLVPADNYFVHPSYEDRVLFVASEAHLSYRQTVDFLARRDCFHSRCWHRCARSRRRARVPPVGKGVAAREGAASCPPPQARPTAAATRGGRRGRAGLSTVDRERVEER